MINVHVENFDNYNDFLRILQTRKRANWYDIDHTKRAFTGNEGLQDSMELLKSGDADAAARLLPQNVAKVKSIADKRGRGVQGYAPIVPLVINSVPRCMRTQERARVPYKVLNLLVDVTYSCGIKQSEVDERGRKLCEFIKGAERAGYRIGLSIGAVFSRDGYENAYCARIKVKDASKPLDIKRVAYPLTHASMFRQLLFDWYEKYPDAEHLSGYGYALYFCKPDHRADVLSKLCKRGERYLALMRDTPTHALFEG